MMTVRRLAIILSVIALGLAGYNYTQKPDPAIATCLNFGDATDIIAACTALLKGSDVQPADLVAILVKRAWAARRMQNYDQAIADIDDALALQPENVWVWVYRAYINEASGDRVAVAKDFERALALEPDSISTITDRAGIFFRRDEFVQALQDYERASEIAPTNKRAAMGIIHTLEKMGVYDAAIERWMAAARQWPEDADILYNLGSLQYGTQNYPAALASFEAAARLNPEHALNMFLLGATNLRLGNTALGKSYIEQHAAQFAWSMATDGGLFRRAIGLASNLTQLAGNPEFFFQGVSYAIVDQPALSRAAFQRYLDSGGNNAMLIMQGLLADYYECAGSGCAEHNDEGYEAALSRYIDAVGSTFLLDKY